MVANLYFRSMIVAMELKDIIKDAVTISQDASFKDAISKMVSDQSNTLIAVDEDGKLVGEVHVSDLLDAIVPEYLDGDSIAANFATEEMFEEAVRGATEKPVRDFMTPDLDPVDEEVLSIFSQTSSELRTQRRDLYLRYRRRAEHVFVLFIIIFITF
jgi:CBS domain-containing protein